MATNKDSFTFFATIPPTKSAIIVSGDDHPCVQLKLEVPATEAKNFPRLLSLGGKILVVTIDFLDEKPLGSGEAE